MISRKNFSIETDNSINRFNNFYEDFIIDFTIHYNQEGKELDYKFLSLMNKIFCNIMQSNYFIKSHDNNYQLVNYHNAYLTIHNKSDKVNLSYYIMTNTIKNISSDLLVKINTLQDDIENIINDEDYSSFKERHEAKNKFIEVVSSAFTDNERKEFNKFLINFPEYNFFFKKKTIQEIITSKANNELEIIKKDSFVDHYNDIKTIFPSGFYEKFKDENEEFYKIKQFIKYDLELDYLYDEEELVDKDIWFTFKKNNEYLGGAYIHSDKYSTFLDRLNILKYERNEINIKKALKNIINQPEVKNDLILFNTSIFSDYFSNKEIRKINKDKRIYFSMNEHKLFLDMSFFIESNNLENYKEEILNDFYHKVIIEKQHYINSDKFEYQKDIFNNSIKEKYLKNDEIKEILDRESFINNIIYKHTPDLLYDHLTKKLKRLDFIFEDTIDKKTKNSSVTKNLIKFLDKIDIPIKEESRLLIFSNIHKIGEFIESEQYDYQKEKNNEYFKFNYNILYDFLIDNNILPKGNLVKLYRLENLNEEGIYRGKNNIFNRNKMLEYSDKKLPHQERNLCQIFNSDIIENNYLKNLYFGFSNEIQLKNWFLHDIKDLTNAKVKLFEYEINENYLLSTSKQVAFLKDRSISKKELNLNNFLGINKVKTKIKIKKTL